MGGDYAPHDIVEGAVAYLRTSHAPVHVSLVGDIQRMRECLASLGAPADAFELVHAPEVAHMQEAPARALRRKRHTSVAVAVRCVREGAADAVVTAGNTGAAVAAAKLEWRTLPGIQRPAIAALIPGPRGATVLIDAGATVNCKAEHLFQFAHMGACYAHHVLGRTHPVVGLLSVGAEDDKGNTVTHDAFRLLRDSSLHFFGNVEGQDVFSGKVDVIVCDGFVGNVALKVMEGMAHGMRTMLQRQTHKNTVLRTLHTLLIQPLLRHAGVRLDVDRFGGAPLLGVNGTLICAHGNSRARAIAHAIERAREVAAYHLHTRITDVITHI